MRLLLIAIVLSAAPVFAETTAPRAATAPTTTRGAVADLSTPTAALTRFVSAFQQGQIARVSKDNPCVYVAPEEKELLDAVLASGSAMVQLQREVAEHFGPMGKNFVDVGPLGSETVLAEIAKAKPVIEGDQASIALKGADTPVKLRRVDGRWLLDGAATFNLPATPPAQRRELARVLHAAAQAADEVRAAIRGGRYATVQAAKQALQEQLLVRAAGATTSPAPGR